MSSKTEYLCVYDYGTGGIWFVMDAHSQEKIESKLPGITVYPDKPGWMSADQKSEWVSRCKDKGFHWDIDERPSGWLKTYLEMETG